MTNRARFALIAIAILSAMTFAWRLWSELGLVTIDADSAPLDRVLRSIEKQTGIAIATDAPTGTTVTMHVIRVPLTRALRVLATATDATWTVAYLVAPDATEIRAELGRYADGQTTGWKRFTIPTPPMPGLTGSHDPREDRWQPQPEENLHAYLEQGARAVEGQFWVPDDFNPVINAPLSANRVEFVVRDLAQAADATAERVFLLTTQSRPEPTEVVPAAGITGGPPVGAPFFAGVPVDRAVIDAQIQARIDQMPAEQRASAQAAFDEGKAFFNTIEALPAIEREGKIADHFANAMERNPGQMDARMTQIDASQTVEQRIEFFRRVVRDRNAE